MSISAAGSSGGIVIPKDAVLHSIKESNVIKIDLSDEDMARRMEVLKEIDGLTAEEKNEKFSFGRKADNHPDNLWGTIELNNQTIKIYNNGGIEMPQRLAIDLDDVHGAQNRADAIMSEYGGKFERNTNQQNTYVETGPTKYQTLLSEFFAFSEKMREAVIRAREVA